MPCYLSKTSYYDSKPWALQKEAKALNYWISEAKLLNEWKFFFANTSHSIYQNENCKIRLKKRVQRSWVWWRRACPPSTQKTEQEDRRFAVSRTKGRFSDVKRKRRGLSLSQVQTQGRDCVSRCPRPTWTWFSPSLLSTVFRHRPGLSLWLERMLRPALLTPWELVLWKFPASCQGNSALIVLGNSKEVFFLREGKNKTKQNIDEK